MVSVRRIGAKHAVKGVPGSRRRWARLGAVVGTVVFLAGCASGGSSDPTLGDGKLIPITMTVFPSSDLLAVQVGIEDGTFEEYGFDLTLETVPDQSALVASITSGAADFATLGSIAAFTAVSQGVPICMVSAYSFAPQEGGVEVIARRDSGIESFADLAGKTVGASSIHSVYELALRNAARAAGADPTDFELALVFGPDAQGAVTQGRVDAVMLPDPFLTTALEDPEIVSLGNPWAETEAGPGGAIFTSAQYAEGNAERVERFHEAVADVSSRVQADPDLARAAIPGLLGLEEDIAQSMGLPNYLTDMPEEVYERTMDDVVGYGWLDRDVVPTLDEITCQTAER